MNQLTQAAFERVRRERDAATSAVQGNAKLVEHLIAGLFPQQRDLIRDPSRFKAALCTRRAGKSTSAIRYMLIVALEKRGANVQYCALTAKKARKEIWPDLKRTCRQYGIEAVFNETTLTVKLNDSTINLDGCEDAGEVEKFRGSDGGYDLFIVDESKSYDPGTFSELVYDVVGPALADRMGTLMVIGTPGRTLAGPFFDVTSAGATELKKRDDGSLHALSRPYSERDADAYRDVEFEWSFHRWYTKDNVAKPHIWLEQLATKRRNGWTDEDPVWRREYCGEWVADDKGYVYRYAAGRNDWTDEEDGNEYGLPSAHDWRYLLGCDIGYDDDFAVVIAAWSESSSTFYFLEEFGKPGLDVTSQAGVIQSFKDKYNPDIMVGDRGALGKEIFAEFENRHGLTILPADKHEKRDYQELLNSDLLSGRCKLRKGMRLARQMSSLQWKADGKTEDKESSPKDLCDAALYVWRYCYHHYSKPIPEKLAMQDERRLITTAAERRAKMQREAVHKSFLDSEERRMEGGVDGADYLDSDDREDWA